MIQHADEGVNWVEKNLCTMSKSATFRPYQVEVPSTKLNYSYATVVVRPIYDTVPTNLNYAGGRSSRAVHSNSNKDDAVLIQQRLLVLLPKQYNHLQDCNAPSWPYL
jgi:hypothetical protein